MSIRRFGAAVVCVVLSATGNARLAAQPASAANVVESKNYFKAGASAYELGDYQAAIQALAAAYRLTPLPAIAFSLAQAERRQFFASREPAHLTRAIELYREYLRQVPNAGRRADATDALSQLEPLAALGVGPAGPVAAAPERTRLMITCNAPAANVVLDGAPSTPAPAILQVTPGMHQLLVSAAGYFPMERAIEAIAGELIPLEVTLREQPASVILHAQPEAELHLDGAPVGAVGAERRLQLASGSHVFEFAKTGYRAQLVRAELQPGSTRELTLKLEATSQRTAAISLFIASGAALLTGAVFAALALERENAAQTLLERRAQANITPAQLAEYDEAKRDRNRLRVAAVTGLAISFSAFAVGLGLYLLDAPELQEHAAAEQHGLRLRVALPLGSGAGRALGAQGELRF